MPKTRPPYAPEFRRQIVELVRAGRDPTDLAREFAPSARANRSRVYVNAMAESFFSILESELLARRCFTSQVEARTACFSYIEGWYNPVHLHQAVELQPQLAKSAQPSTGPRGSPIPI
jgi:transposase InsO family protein